MEKIRQSLLCCVIGVVRLYQFLLSPLLGYRCRFFPSCSDYLCDAVNEHGLLKGILMGCGRLCRCHPFCPGGEDPVVKK